MPGLPMLALVVDRFDPRLKRAVEVLQGRWRVVLELAGHSFSDSSEHALDLPAPLRSSRPRVDQPDPEHRARPQQLTRHKRAAVVNIDGTRPAACGHPGPQRPCRVSARPPAPPTDTRPAAGCDRQESRTDRSAGRRSTGRATIPRPQLISLLSLKPAQRTPDLPALPRQPHGREVTLDRPRRR